MLVDRLSKFKIRVSGAAYSTLPLLRGLTEKYNYNLCHGRYFRVAVFYWNVDFEKSLV